MSRRAKNDLPRGGPTGWAEAVVIIERFLKGRMMRPRNEGGIGFRGEDSERLQSPNEPQRQDPPYFNPDD